MGLNRFLLLFLVAQLVQPTRIDSPTSPISLSLNETERKRDADMTGRKSNEVQCWIYR